MGLEEFARLAEAWGAEIARWPEGARAQAAELAGSPQAAAILAEQRRLDLLLRDATPHIAQERVDRALHAVVRRLAEPKPRARLIDRLPRWLIPATGFACALAIGALVAAIEPLADTDAGDMRAMLTNILDANQADQEWTIL